MTDVSREDFLKVPQEVRIRLLTPYLQNKEALLELMKKWNKTLYDFLQAGKEDVPEVYDPLENELAHVFIQTYLLTKEELDAIEAYMHDNDADDLCTAANAGDEDAVMEYTDFKMMKRIFLHDTFFSPYFQSVIEGCNSRESFLLCLHTAQQLNTQLYTGLYSISQMPYKTIVPFKVYGGNGLYVPNTSRFASIKPGDEIRLGYPLSTSINIDIAYKFCKNGVIIMGTVQPGTSVTFIGNGNELEVLLPPGTILRRKPTVAINTISEDSDVLILDFDISFESLPQPDAFEHIVDENAALLMESIEDRYKGVDLPMLVVGQRPESDSQASDTSPKIVHKRTPPAVMEELKREQGQHIIQHGKIGRFDSKVVDALLGYAEPLQRPFQHEIEGEPAIVGQAEEPSPSRKSKRQQPELPRKSKRQEPRLEPSRKSKRQEPRPEPSRQEKPRPQEPRPKKPNKRGGKIKTRNKIRNNKTKHR
jgi:hypothetical protein